MVRVWARPGATEGTLDPHAALRMILARELGVDAASVSIARDCRWCGDPTHGKPFVRDAPELSFNLSHSGRAALVAVAWQTCVGVDVELLRPRRYLDRLAARVLTQPEHDEWQQTPGSRQLEVFLERWTAKEAYLKAIGRGLRVSLRDTPAVRPGWTTRAVEIDGAVACVAAEGEVQVRTEAWPSIASDGTGG